MTLLTFNVHGMVEIRHSRIWCIAWAVNDDSKKLEVADDVHFDESLPEIPVGENYFVMFSADIEQGGRARIATHQLQKSISIDLASMPQVKAALKRITNKMARAAGFRAPPLVREH